jgi:hypothetical protein
VARRPKTNPILKRGSRQMREPPSMMRSPMPRVSAESGDRRRGAVLPDSLGAARSDVRASGPLGHRRFLAELLLVKSPIRTAPQH